VRLLIVAFSLALMATRVCAAGLTPERLGIVFDIDDSASMQIAELYAARRRVPAVNVIGLPVPHRDVIDRAALATLRSALLARLPSEVQSLLLVWSRPYAVECMSVTTAMAAGYRPEFCEPGCGRTALSPLFDVDGWLPADTTGWLPAMLLPSDDDGLARAVIDRGIRADGSRPDGTVYLVRTPDVARNVRAATYGDVRMVIGARIGIIDGTAPAQGAIVDAVGYFTGIQRVPELGRISFRPGAVADHLTSTGGVLDGSAQMSILEWLRQGATASYGTVSEPCNHPGKFPSPAVLFDHYLRGDSVLEAYWKSVAMPGQGLFIGEPLAQPFGTRP
jgi:uncharacterized protein (TIGR03790 family)